MKAPVSATTSHARREVTPQGSRRKSAAVQSMLVMVSVAVIAFAPYVSAESEKLNDLKNIDIEKLKEQLPEGLIPPEFQNITLPSLDDIQKIVKDKCSKIAGSDAAYEQASQAGERLSECMKDLVDFSDLEKEINIAKPTGDLDSVFNKYCRRRSTAIECMDTFSNEINSCLDEDEQESKRVLMNIIHGLLNFVCHKDGDQIALFIAEEGPECFSEQKQPLIDCFNKTMRGYLEESTPKEGASQSTPKFVLGEKQCRDMDNLKVCFVTVLEDCRESTPANLVESLFKFVRRETPCANYTIQAIPSKRNVADATNVSLQVIFSTLLLALIAKLVRN